MSMSDEERIKFVNDLDIPAYPWTTDGSAAVVAGSCIALLSNVGGQMKTDILYSTLLAQLAADKSHDRQNEVKEWYEAYRASLEKVGWVVHSFDLALVNDASSCEAVDKLILKLAAHYLPREEFELFQEMIDALKDDANKDAVALFDSFAKKLNKANFQLGVASNSNGNALVKVGVYTYEASQDIDRVLFTFGSQMVSFYAGNQVMVLDEEVYAAVREDVLKKLGRSHDIKGIQLQHRLGV